jgi:hypothetical protein
MLLTRAFCALLRFLLCSRAALPAENLALRYQLAVLRRPVKAASPTGGHIRAYAHYGGNASLIATTEPLLIVFLAWLFFRERIPWRTGCSGSRCPWRAAAWSQARTVPVAPAILSVIPRWCSTPCSPPFTSPA